MRAAILGAFVAACAVMADGASASAAGRVPYGGDVALPVASYGGLLDPHTALTRDDRTLAAVGHCHLYRPAGDARVVPELAQPDAVWRGRRLIIQLRPARFHGGGGVGPDDVVRSLRRLGELGAQTPWGAAFAALEVSAVDGWRVAIEAPAGTQLEELQLLLARPEAAILRGGRPGDGRSCGPWQLAGKRDGVWRLTAFDGHPEGRPWLDGLTVKRVADDAAEQSAFVFGDVDVAFADGLRSRRVGRAAPGGAGSYLLIVHPRYRGPEGAGLRRAVASLAQRGGLARFVEGRAAAATGPWPSALAPTRASYVPPSTLPTLPSLTLAFADGDRELGDLARAMRDTLRPLTAGSARAIGVRGLDARAAVGARSSEWDVAVVRWEWSALSKAQAAWEAARALGGGALTVGAMLSRRTGKWAAAATEGADVVAILHVERPVLVRGGLALDGVAAGVPDLAGAWRRR